MHYDVKQVLIIRELYPDGKGGLRKIRSGKLIAQACHATMKVFFDLGMVSDSQLHVPLTEDMAAWVTGVFAKVVLIVETEELLLKAYELAKEKGIPCSLITDCGLTEFSNVPTHTAVAIGPAKSALIDEITGHSGIIPTRLA